MNTVNTFFRPFHELGYDGPNKMVLMAGGKSPGESESFLASWSRKSYQPSDGMEAIAESNRIDQQVKNYLLENYPKKGVYSREEIVADVLAATGVALDKISVVFFGKHLHPDFDAPQTQAIDSPNGLVDMG